MSKPLTQPDPRPDTPPEARLARRRLFAGAGAAGALAGAAVVLPLAQRSEEPAAAATPEPAAGGGYRVTQHVLRYYETTRV